jgi:hypothetical protein
MTNDEIPNDERSPNDEIRMTNAGSAGVAVMAGVGARGSKKTFNIQHSTFNIQHSTFNAQRSTAGSSGVAGTAASQHSIKNQEPRSLPTIITTAPALPA